MRLLENILLLAALLLGVSARIQIGSNLTVAFFPSSEEATCEQNDISNAISLTTNTIPDHFVCFNLTDLFTQSSDNGIQDIWKHHGQTLSEGVEYSLGNRISYNTDANYTNVWYQQVNATGNMEPGADGSWVFYIYDFPDCVQNGGDDYPMEDYPWFETSCQTQSGGVCQQLPKSVVSFGINRAAAYNPGHGGCNLWGKFGDATTMYARNSALLFVAATIAVVSIL